MEHGYCPCYQRINNAFPTIHMKPDREVGQATFIEQMVL